MLINLRDEYNELTIKDILDINFDMHVEEKDNKYYVTINRRFTLDDSFENKELAEAKMLSIADCRNRLEVELESY